MAAVVAACVAGLILAAALFAGHQGNPPSSPAAAPSQVSGSSPAPLSDPSQPLDAASAAAGGGPGSVGSDPSAGAPAVTDPATGGPTAGGAGGSDPGCAPAEDAITAVTDDFGHDLGNPTASVADAQKAVDLADTAARVAVDPAVKRAVDTMRTHLEALHAAAQTSDFGTEATTLQSIEGDIDAVFSACGA